MEGHPKLFAVARDLADPPEDPTPTAEAYVPPVDYALAALLSARLDFELAVRLSWGAADHRRGPVYPLRVRPPSYGPGNKTKSKAAPKKWDPATDFDKWSNWSWWEPQGEPVEKRVLPRDALFLPAPRDMAALLHIDDRYTFLVDVFGAYIPPLHDSPVYSSSYAVAIETVAGTPDTTFLALQVHGATAKWLPAWLACATVRDLEPGHVCKPVDTLRALYYSPPAIARRGYSCLLKRAEWEKLGAAYLSTRILVEMDISYSVYTPSLYKLLDGLGFRQEKVLAGAVMEALGRSKAAAHIYDSWLNTALFYSDGPLIDAFFGDFSAKNAKVSEKALRWLLTTPPRDPPAPPGRGREEALLRYIPLLSAAELSTALKEPHCCSVGHFCPNIGSHSEWTPNPRLYTEAARRLSAIRGAARLEAAPLRPNISSPGMLVFFLRLGLDLDLDPGSFPDLLHLYDNARKLGLVGGSGFPDDPAAAIKEISRWTGQANPAYGTF